MLNLKEHPTNLPLQLTSLIGRERELAQLEPLVLTSRLLTLAGPGGMGKTRLAAELGRRMIAEFAHGVWIVELAPIGDPALVPKAVAQVLGLVEQPGHSVVDSLADTLESREMLLILDNCEHLVAACADLLHTLLSRCCSDLRILATSRESIGIPGEITWRVSSLSVPPLQPSSPNPQALEQYEAVRLFVERAQTTAPHFTLQEQNAAAIAQICRRLDGMPLAIELAAARARALSVNEIAKRLDERFSLLTTNLRTAPARHQTLAATLDWSYALLTNPEQIVLRRLSVFAGGCTLEAAEAIVTDLSSDPEPRIHPTAILDLLSRTVDKSLVVMQEQADGTRYHLLETIQQYASVRLAEAGEEETARNRHLTHYLRLAEQADPQLRGPGIIAWLERLDAEHDNFRAALGWVLRRAEHSEEAAENALRLAGALAYFWLLRSHLEEGRNWLDKVLALPLGSFPTPDRGRALFYAARLAWLQGDYSQSQTLLEQSCDAWTELGPAGDRGLAEAISFMGMVSNSRDNPAAARAFFEQGLALGREIGDEQVIAKTQSFMALLAVALGDPTAKLLCEESLIIFRKVGDLWSIARLVQTLAHVSRLQSDPIAARLHYEESLADDRKLGFKPGAAASLTELGDLFRLMGDLAQATAHYQEVMSLCDEIGLPYEIATAKYGLGLVALQKDDSEGARILFEESLATRHKMNEVEGAGCCLAHLARVYASNGRPRRAARILGAAAGLLERTGTEIYLHDQQDYEQSVDTVRRMLDPAQLEADWTAGRALEIEEAIAYALTDPEEEVGAVTRPPSLTLLRAAKAQFGGLTARERQVAALVAQGKSNREIAEQLVVGERTADAHISNILSKLEFTSRTQIATWAIAKGLAALPVN